MTKATPTRASSTVDRTVRSSATCAVNRPRAHTVRSARSATFGPRGLSLFVRRLEPSARLCRTAEKRSDRRGHRRLSRALPAARRWPADLPAVRARSPCSASARSPEPTRRAVSQQAAVPDCHGCAGWWRGTTRWTQQDGSSLNKCLTTKLLPRRRTIRSSELDVDEWPLDSPGRAELLERFCERISDAFDVGQRRFQGAPNTPGAGTIEPFYA